MRAETLPLACRVAYHCFVSGLLVLTCLCGRLRMCRFVCQIDASVGGAPGMSWAWPSFLDAGTHSDAWCRSETEGPHYTFPAHSAPSGITFFKHKESWPENCTGGFTEEFDGAAFVALHGNHQPDVPFIGRCGSQWHCEHTTTSLTRCVTRRHTALAEPQTCVCVRARESNARQTMPENTTVAPWLV